MVQPDSFYEYFCLQLHPKRAQVNNLPGVPNWILEWSPSFALGVFEKSNPQICSLSIGNFFALIYDFVINPERQVRTQLETQKLLDQLEAVLVRLSYENFEPPGSCCHCLQDVDKRGHLPNCIISQALIAIEEWRE